MDVSQLTTDDLRKLAEQVDRKLNEHRVQQISAARAQILKIAKEAGISASELISVGKRGKQSSSAKGNGRKSSSNGHAVPNDPVVSSSGQRPH